MDQNEESGMFTFIWNIENFSMCPQRRGQKIVSSTFTVEALGTAKWNMILFPKGNSDDGQGVSCYLKRTKGEDEPEEVTITYKIGLMQDNKPLSFLFFMDTIETLGRQHFVALSSLQKYKNDYLSNDVLTVACTIKVGTQSSKKTTELTKNVCQSVARNIRYDLGEMCTAVSDDKMPTEQFLNLCSSRTRIPVHRKEIRWIIQNFKDQMQSGKKISFSFVSKLREKSIILLNCYLSGDWNSDGTIRIDIQRKDKECKQMFMKGKVSVMDKIDAVPETREDEHLFREGYEVWSFPSLISTSTIENWETLNDRALTLKCEFLISYIGEEVTVGKADIETTNSIITCDLIRSQIDMLNKQELTDVTLISEGHQLSLHKSVICAWSPVFRAMFNSDTEEKRTGIVRITDVEFSTLMNMRSFMYENRIPDLEPEDVIKLYTAAEKYEIPTLKKECVFNLKYNLSLSNVCDVLVLADLHKDADLLNYIHNFLRVHLDKVFESNEWTKLMETNIKLAGDTMRKLLVVIGNRNHRCQILNSDEHEERYV